MTAANELWLPTKPTGRTSIAFEQEPESYAQTLFSAFDGTLSREDLLTSLGSPWVPLGSESQITTEDGVHTYWIKNLTTNFDTYVINFFNVNCDTTVSLDDHVIFLFSTDLGITWEDGTLSYAVRTHGPLGEFENEGVEQGEFDSHICEPPVQDSQMSGNFVLWVTHAASDTKHTDVVFEINIIGTGTTAGDKATHAGGMAVENTNAHNAIGFYIKDPVSDRRWLDGHVDVWGLESAT
jgi:hypothetical protein